MCILLVWNTVDSMKKPMKPKPMKKPMMAGGLCLKEEDMMKFCLVGSSLQSKTENAEENCNDDGSDGAQDVFNRIVRGVEQRRKKKPGNKGTGKRPNKKPVKRPNKKPGKNQGKPKPKPEQCPSLDKVIKAFEIAYEEEVCLMYEFGWLDMYGLEAENIEADLRNLTTIL